AMQAIEMTSNANDTTSTAIANNSPVHIPVATTSSEKFPRAIEGVTFRPDFNNPDQGRRNSILVGSVRLTQRVNENVSYTLAYQKVSTRRRNYNGPKLDPRFAFLSPFGDFAFN